MSHSVDMQCWKCGSELKNLLLPFSRFEECPTCNADLRVCLACRHYDPNISDACHEDRAEFVLDKDKANFCDYFKVNSKAYKPQKGDDAAAARRKLAELFNEKPATTNNEAPTADTTASQSEANKALLELQRLFGDKIDKS